MFSIRLKQLREESGMSQAALAKKMGIGQSTVGMWENGGNMPKIQNLRKLAGIFGVSVDFLTGETDAKGTDKTENSDSIDTSGRSLFGGPTEEHALDEILKKLEQHIEARQSAVPQTKEARLVSAGIDRMPPEKRKRAQELMELMFSEFYDKHYEEGIVVDDDDTEL